MEKKSLALLFLFFIVFASGFGRNMVEVEGATCTKPSMYYHGWCVSGCTTACERENWPGGECVGGPFTARCECQRPC